MSLNCIATLEGHVDRAWHLSWHPKLPVIATCGGDKTIRIWANRSEKLSSFDDWKNIKMLEDFSARTIRCVEWSPCGTYLAAGSFDGNVYIFKFSWPAPEDMSFLEYSIQAALVATLEGHENEVKCVAWSSSGSFLASCSRDKTIWLWDGSEESEFECLSILSGHEQDVKHIRWHPNREILVSCSYDNAIRVWGEAEDEWICIQQVLGHDSTVWSIAFSPKGDHLVSVSDDKRVCVWDVTPVAAESSLVIDAVELTLATTITNAHNRTIFSCDWSSETNGDNRSRIATCGADDCIRIIKSLEATEGKSTEYHIFLTVNNAHKSDVNCVRWCPSDSSILASCGDDFLIKIWRYTE